MLHIKNMVCQRCVMTVENILKKEGIDYDFVTLGEVKLKKALSKGEKANLEEELNKVGFELIEGRVNKIIDDIKKLILNYLEDDHEEKKQKLSSYITTVIPYDYSYLSDLFSSVEGTTIEQYFILLRIEKVKEHLVYDQLSLSEIADKTGFSSVHHLSAQFKKVTGLTPSHFKKIGSQKRKSIDRIA